MKYIGFIPGSITDPNVFDSIKELEHWVDGMMEEGVLLNEITVFEIGKELEFKVSIQPKATVAR